MSLRRYGLAGLLVAAWQFFLRLIRGTEPFCPWPGCWNRVDESCSGVMYGRQDERYCTQHCSRYHRDSAAMRWAGIQACCPLPRLRAVKDEGNEGT